uniref:P3 protein-like n=1 Tax=Myxine glutinosa TaxID=7769 RepID=UPI00358EEA99
MPDSVLASSFVATYILMVFSAKPTGSFASVLQAAPHVNNVGIAHFAKRSVESGTRVELPHRAIPETQNAGKKSTEDDASTEAIHVPTEVDNNLENNRDKNSHHITDGNNCRNKTSLSNNGTGKSGGKARVLSTSHFTDNPVLYILLPFVLFNKCAFGCQLKIDVLCGLAHRPIPVLLAMAFQFVIAPMYGFALSRVLDFTTDLSLGLVVACSCPGGGGGYLYSLLLDGDVTLAIAMTLVSTAVAMVAMPASSAFYNWLLGAHNSLHIPFLKIFSTLLFILLPVSLGVLIKHRCPNTAAALLDVIRPISVIILAGGVYLATHVAVNILPGCDGRIFIAAVLVPFSGLLFGFVGSRLVGLHQGAARSVAIECGVQNSFLALAVLQLSFEQDQADHASCAPFAVALCTVGEMWLILGTYILHGRLCKRKDGL